MDTKTIIRAWKDPAYRASLSAEQRTALPENPSGKSTMELSEEALGQVLGGDLLELSPIQIRFLTKETTPVVSNVPLTSPHHVCISLDTR